MGPFKILLTHFPSRPNRSDSYFTLEVSKESPHISLESLIVYRAAPAIHLQRVGNAAATTDQSTAFNFSAIVPSIEDVDHDTGRDPHSRNAGRRTSSESDFESPDEWIHTPSHSSVAPFEPANSLGISERLRELSLSPGQSTSTNAGNTTSLRADTSERHTSLSDPLPSPSQLDLDGDRMNTGSENGSNTSSLDDVPQGPLPQAPVYDSDLQAVLRDVKEHLASICSDMERCSLIADQESDLSKQFEQVRMASQLDCPETRTVGFIGDSGVGKSRLINSLLDINGLARSVCR